jgi:alkylhydroperoxidase family enzyme
VRVTHQPASVGADEVELLRGHGWTDAAIHDAIQVVSYFNYVNRVADAVGIEDEPEWAE